MAHTNNQVDTHPPHSGPAFGLGDLSFVLLLVAAMVAVVFSGRFAYREGMLLESAKDNAAQFMKWTEAVAASDGKAEPFTLALCASMPGAAPQEIAAGVAPQGAAGLPAGQKEGAESAPAAQAAAPGAEGEPAGAAPDAPQVATTWATCREALFTAGGPLSHLSNPFDSAIAVAGNKCERRSRTTRGVVYVQKGTPPPPGVPGGTSWSPIDDEEPMVRGLLLKVQVCDAGGYTVGIGEVKL